MTMGTRADFYVGRGEQAEWLGSIASDGSPEGHATALVGLTEASSYRLAVQTILECVGHATRPEQGWPWPWPNSQTTDFAYAWDAGVVYVTCFGHGWQVLRDDLDDWQGDDPKVPFPAMSDEGDPRALTCWDLLERLRTVMRDDDENLYATTFLKLALSELLSKRAWETDWSRAQVARWLQTDFVPEVLSLYDVLQSRPEPAAGAGEGEA
jgi:hypothetical protein